MPREVAEQLRFAALEAQLGTSRPAGSRNSTEWSSFSPASVVAQLDLKNAEAASPLDFALYSTVVREAPRSIPDLASAILFAFDRDGTLDEYLERFLGGAGATTTMTGEQFSEEGTTGTPGNTRLGRRLVVKLLKGRLIRADS